MRATILTKMYPVGLYGTWQHLRCIKKLTGMNHDLENVKKDLSVLQKFSESNTCITNQEGKFLLLSK